MAGNEGGLQGHGQGRLPAGQPAGSAALRSGPARLPVDACRVALHRDVQSAGFRVGAAGSETCWGSWGKLPARRSASLTLRDRASSSPSHMPPSSAPVPSSLLSLPSAQPIRRMICQPQPLGATKPHGCKPVLRRAAMRHGLLPRCLPRQPAAVQRQRAPGATPWLPCTKLPSVAARLAPPLPPPPWQQRLRQRLAPPLPPHASAGEFRNACQPEDLQLGGSSVASIPGISQAGCLRDCVRRAAPSSTRHTLAGGRRRQWQLSRPAPLHPASAGDV